MNVYYSRETNENEILEIQKKKKKLSIALIIVRSRMSKDSLRFVKAVKFGID